jgi:hypothetical protein
MNKLLALFVAAAMFATFSIGRITGSIEMFTALHAQEEKTPALSELQRLKAENHKLKITVAQLQAQTNECVLNGERSLLTDEFMKTLGGKPGEMFDWNTLTIQKEKSSGTDSKTSK